MEKVGGGSARIGVGGLENIIGTVIDQLRRHTDLIVIEQPSLLGKATPWNLVKQIWQNSAQIDLYYGVYYGQWLRYVIAHLRGKGVVCHWVGNDIFPILYNRFHRWWFLTVVNRCIDRNLVISENLGEELAKFGIRTEHLPITSDLAQIDVQPLPEQFAILAYVPFTNQSDLYGAPVLYEIAKRNPQWPVYILGPEPILWERPLANLHEIRWVPDITELYDRITVLVRPTGHDGLPRMILEALSRGRYVVFSRPFPHSLQGQTVQEIEQALQELGRRTEPNLAGAAYVQETYNEAKIATSLKKIFCEILEQKPALKSCNNHV